MEGFPAMFTLGAEGYADDRIADGPAPNSPCATTSATSASSRAPCPNSPGFPRVFVPEAQGVGDDAAWPLLRHRE